MWNRPELYHLRTFSKGFTNLQFVRLCQFSNLSTEILANQMWKSTRFQPHKLRYNIQTESLHKCLNLPKNNIYSLRIRQLYTRVITFQPLLTLHPKLMISETPSKK